MKTMAMKKTRNQKKKKKKTLDSYLLYYGFGSLYLRKWGLFVHGLRSSLSPANLGRQFCNYSDFFAWCLLLFSSRHCRCVCFDCGALRLQFSRVLGFDSLRSIPSAVLSLSAAVHVRCCRESVRFVHGNSLVFCKTFWWRRWKRVVVEGRVFCGRTSRKVTLVGTVLRWCHCYIGIFLVPLSSFQLPSFVFPYVAYALLLESCRF